MKKTKVIAFFLPQYHEVEQNNQWWGKGFTDWVSAKGAQKIYPGHYQPRTPLNHNYYDLTEKSVMEWQTNLARQAGVYGFCYYHYWFGNGEKILEKPAENLLKWKDIKQRFCFSWANQSWIRSWSRYDGNAWSKLQDDNGGERGNQGDGMLLRQVYGGEQEWRRHFEYLLPFFQDKRYIKCDGKPLFVIHKPGDILCLRQMLNCFRKWSREAGLPGLYVVAANDFSDHVSSTDATLLFEPSYTYKSNGEFAFWRNCLKKMHMTLTAYSYDHIWMRILLRRFPADRKVYLGAFTDFDTTPRQGKNGIVMLGNFPWKFYVYFKKLIHKSRKTDREFLFINAWNEWGEGAYLEPDEKYGYSLLNAVRAAQEE